MTQREVLAAALKRATALAQRDGKTLRELLHPAFRWTSHKGDQFDLETYLRSNTEGRNTWHAQTLDAPAIVLFGSTAVLTCTVTDEVTTADGRTQYRMPMTQVWVHEHGSWLIAAGHAGPLL